MYSLKLKPDSISDSQERLVDNHEEGGDDWRVSDSPERRQPGQTGLATRSVSSARRAPKQATENQMDKYPQGCPRGGEDEHPIRTDTTASDHGNEQTDSSKKCVCGKTCKNQRGLKIHQARMKCLEVEIPSTTHRCSTCMKFEKRRIKWPAANMSSQWSQFDSDVDQILEATGKGDVDKKLLSLTTMIVNIGAERFGQEERKEPSIGGHPMNKREIKIHNIRQEMKSLRRQYKYAGEYERLGLAHLMSIQRKKIGILRRAEWHRRRRRERSRKRAAFISDPFRLTKQLLGQKRNGKLECSQEELDHYLDDVYSDPTREQDLGECKILIEPPPPTVPYDVSELRLSEVSEVIKKARAGSAPGPSGTCYKVYKNCPKLLTRLWKILRVIWRRGRIPEFWKATEGVLITKGGKLKEDRPVSDYFSLMCRSQDLLQRSLQKKGGVPGVSGCLEHTGVVTQLIREARENKGNLSVLWLDLENAYGSIPHKLVELTLTKHHVPQRVIDLVTDYYSNFRIRVSSGAVTSSWHNLELGIITGCTISVMLFSLAMNMIVKSAEPECRGPKSKSGQRQPPIRAFMDDLTVTTESVSGCRWILQGLQKLVKWARMSFKPAKSRSMVLRKGSVDSKFQFSIAGTAIPTISEKPVKSLGKVFDSSLKDTESIKVTIASLDTWLKAVDRSGLPGKFKAWIYQHGVLPRILWPLLIYEVPITTIETLERKISSHLRRWLGLPKSLSSIALYGRSNKLQLPLKSLEEEYKVSKTRVVLQYKDSEDSMVSNAGIEVKTGRKWRAEEAVQQAESRLHFSKLVGAVTRGRAGLGSIPAPKIPSKRKEKRCQVQSEVRAVLEERRTCKAVGMSKQGAWARWENAIQRRVTWNELWKAEPHRIKFLIQAVYDVLPSPSNLHNWGKIESPACVLCSKIGSLEHILSCCPKALGEGRYRWRHDQVLKAIAEAIAGGVEKARHSQIARKNIHFVKAGEVRKTTTPQSRAGILNTAKDWKLLVDLEKQLKVQAI
ncbi:hypothetical protein WMY93_011425 [Mugilogobius chulae]|uniref:Reverse transcriptase domain-containing protein n=1 Tax=Mugilogobius chulae TaxID=88201 RepID=A0AAW0P6G5_9GOBI